MTPTTREQMIAAVKRIKHGVFHLTPTNERDQWLADVEALLAALAAPQQKTDPRASVGSADLLAPRRGGEGGLCMTLPEAQCCGQCECCEAWRKDRDERAAEVQRLREALASTRRAGDTMTREQMVLGLDRLFEFAITALPPYPKKADTEALRAAVLAALAAPVAADPGLCRNGMPHYCANCGNRFTAPVAAEPARVVRTTIHKVPPVDPAEYGEPAADPPSLVALVQEWQRLTAEYEANWPDEVDSDEERADWRAVCDALERVRAWTPAQAEPADKG